MIIKPYLYGGIVLLIVGLFSYGLWTSAKLESYELRLAEANETIDSLRVRNEDLVASGARKAGAAAAYTAMTDWVGLLTNNATGIIKGYRVRDTENAKCLDLIPPADLIERLRQNSVQGQNN